MTPTGSSSFSRPAPVRRRVPLDESSWRLVRSCPVDGLALVGFLPDSKRLLVVGEPGRGEFELCFGVLCARDTSPGGEWFDVTGYRCRAVSEPDVWVPVCGRSGGHCVHRVGVWHLDLSDRSVVARGPDEEVVLVDGHVRAATFSPDGCHVAVVLRSEVLLFARRTPPAG